jgi:hypothetical protein
MSTSGNSLNTTTNLREFLPHFVVDNMPRRKDSLPSTPLLHNNPTLYQVVQKQTQDIIQPKNQITQTSPKQNTREQQNNDNTFNSQAPPTNELNQVMQNNNKNQLHHVYRMYQDARIDELCTRRDDTLKRQSLPPPLFSLLFLLFSSPLNFLL